MTSFLESFTHTVPWVISTWEESGVLLLWQLKMRSCKASIDKALERDGAMCSRGNETMEKEFKGTKEADQTIMKQKRKGIER